MKEAGETLLASSLWAMSKQAYSNWVTVVNESLVRAAVICYMLDNGYSKEAVRKEMNEQLQRNFRWVPGLVRTLRKYERDRHLYPNLESFYPQIIRFFHEYVAKEQKELEV